MQDMEEFLAPASLIPDITHEELEEMNDLFWLKLGIEHCNMREWTSNIAFMLCANLGKSNSNVNLFFRLHRLYSNLSCALDTIICAHYPLSINTLSIPSSFQQTYEYSKLDENECRALIGIFYRSNTIRDYPTTKYVANEKGKRYCGYISPRDMQYITNFITRHEEYLEYLKHICDSMTKTKTRFRIGLNKKITELDSNHHRFQRLLLELRIEENYIIKN